MDDDATPKPDPEPLIPELASSDDGMSGDATGDADPTPEVPAFLQRLIDHDLIDDDIDVAEIAATDGPNYYLGEHTDEEIDAILELVETRGIRAVIDRAGQLTVHYNDERKIEAAFDDLFGADEVAVAAAAAAVRPTEGDLIEDEISELAARITSRKSAPPEAGPGPVKKARWWSRK